MKEIPHVRFRQRQEPIKNTPGVNVNELSTTCEMVRRAKGL